MRCAVGVLVSRGPELVTRADVLSFHSLRCCDVLVSNVPKLVIIERTSCRSTAGGVVDYLVKREVVVPSSSRRFVAS